MGGVSIHVRFSFGSSECFYCSSNFILSKKQEFWFNQVSFIKSIDLRISIFEKVLPTNLSILEFNLLSFISLSFSCTATGWLRTFVMLFITGQTHYKKYFHKSWRERVRHRAKRLFLGLPRERHYNSFYTPKNV